MTDTITSLWTAASTLPAALLSEGHLFPIGDTGYLDCLPNHAFTGAKMVLRGVDGIGRQGLAFRIADVEDLESTAIVTVFQRYSDCSLVVLCYSHSSLAPRSLFDAFLCLVVQRGDLRVREPERMRQFLSRGEVSGEVGFEGGKVKRVTLALV